MATATLRTETLDVSSREHRTSERDEPVSDTDTLVSGNAHPPVYIHSDSRQSIAKWPVEYEDDAAFLNPEAMSVNVPYMFRLDDETYVVVKTPSGEIDFYGVQR